MKKQSCTAQFAVVTDNAKVVTVGKSVIMSPILCYKGSGIEWFDDNKLVRGGDACKL